MSDAKKILVTFPNPHPQRDYLIEHLATEFTSVCPVTGQPDFGNIEFLYIPGDICVELRSFKLYLQSYRTQGIYYEDVTNVLLNDLVDVMNPKWLRVRTNWSVRGGMRSVITVEHGTCPDHLRPHPSSPR